LETSIRSFFAHRAEGDLRVEILRLWAVPIILGVAAGVGVAAVAPSVLFKLAFGVISALLAFKSASGRVGQVIHVQFGPMALTRSASSARQCPLGARLMPGANADLRI